MMQEDKLP